jgi:hypothetical protein
VNRIERLRKLRALAARPGSLAEGETAARLADELERKIAAQTREEWSPFESVDDVERLIRARAEREARRQRERAEMGRAVARGDRKPIRWHEVQVSAARRDDFEFTRNSKFR